MSRIDTVQPEGTPTWIDLGIPDLDRAKEFYGSLFGWEFDTGPLETGSYTICLLRGLPVAALASAEPTGEPTSEYWWSMYFAVDDCDRTAQRITDAGGTLVTEPDDVPELGRLAMATDPVGAHFGLWQSRAFVGCQLVNEPGTLVRNDLITPTPEPARAFYAAVFGFTLDRNKDMPPDFDFTFLRRPDGHEIGGILSGTGPKSAWSTMFEVTDTDAVAKTATANGGTAATPEDTPYGRMTTITDPFGADFTIITRPADTPT